MGFKATRKKTPRAKGEGSIFRRKDGMWVGSIETTPGEAGQRRQRRVYAKDYRRLVAKLEELKTEAAEGYTISRTTTVAQWLEYWLENVHRARIRPTSHRDYTHTVANIVGSIGDVKVADLAPADIRRMHTILGRENRKAAKAHTVLHRAMRDAVAEGIVKRNVVSVVDAPTTVTRDRAALPIGQVQSVLAYAAENCNLMEATRWLFAFLTGTRQGETLGLTWDRVDLEHGAVDITWQLQQLKREHGCDPACGKGNVAYCPAPVWNVPAKFEYVPLHAGLALTRPKSEAGKRWVPIIEPLRQALITLRDADSGPNPHGLVFHRTDGRPVIPSRDNAAWQALLRGAGIIGPGETMPLHTTRHTAATVLRAAGADEQTRMEILGHASAEVTRVYAHADQAKNSAMMDALGVLLPAK